ncbi:MAG TPA: hypothetical protein VK153_00110 [Candidatus Paceibacterota bacterium]|nr:hypothetical protein [Candidatus Paceibacterota bacterium]
MSRLPTVGQDNNEWGTILNDYLSVEHNEDGSQKLLTESVSRTIYVSATGDDTTGDGSVTLPYLTIGKALSTVKKEIVSDVIITISVGAGTFNLNNSDLIILDKISGAGTLVLQGTLALVESGFTMGSAEALDPFTYSVSGGNSSSWVTNQWKYYWLKSSTSYYPITHNENGSSISIVSSVTGTEIYQQTTIININLNNNNNINFSVNNLQINDFRINIPNYKLEFHGKYLSIEESYLSGSGTVSNLSFVCTEGASLRYNSIENSSVGLRCQTGPFAYNYLMSNRNSTLLNINNDTNLQNIYSCVFENPNTGASSRCISLLFGSLMTSAITGTHYIKFVNSYIPFYFVDFVKFSTVADSQKIILKNTNYYYRKGNNDYSINYLNLKLSNIIGTPITRWFYDAMYEFVNVSSGRNIQITGLIYPEYESNLSSTLADNTTTQVIVGNKLQNRSIVIDYTILRGSTYETAQLRILNDGTNLTLQEGTPLGDAGVTFAVNFNTNEIRLACTLTSTGTVATLKYNATRVMITPLTI